MEWSRDGYGTRQSRRERRIRIGLLLLTALFVGLTALVLWVVRDRSGSPGAVGGGVSAVATSVAPLPDEGSDTPAAGSGSSTDADHDDDDSQRTTPDPASPVGPGEDTTETLASPAAPSSGNNTGSDGSAPEPTASPKPVPTTRPERTTTTQKTEASADTTEASGSAANTTVEQDDADPDTTQPAGVSPATTNPETIDTETSASPDPSQVEPDAVDYDENTPIPVGVDLYTEEGVAVGGVTVTFEPGKPGPADNKKRTVRAVDGRAELDVVPGCYVIGLAFDKNYKTTNQRRCFKPVGQRHLVTMTVNVFGTIPPSSCSVRLLSSNSWSLTIREDGGTFARRYQARHPDGKVWALRMYEPVATSATSLTYELSGTWYNDSPDEQIRVMSNNGSQNSRPVFCTVG